MKEPSIRDVAVLPVLAVVAGAVIVVSTVVGQGASATEECGPGSHSMSMGQMHQGSGGSGGMDHSAHMAMGENGSGCMEGDSMQPEKKPAKPNKAKTTHHKHAAH